MSREQYLALRINFSQMSSLMFATCTQSWKAKYEELVIVEDDSGFAIGTFPISFLRLGEGDTATIGYLLRVCRLILFIPAERVIQLQNHDGFLADETMLIPGVYTLDGSFPARAGPSGKTKSRAYRESDSPSTVSKSSRSTTNQNHFKMELLGRDGECSLNGEYRVKNLIACHIVPYSLGQEKLDEICGRFVMNPFSVVNGLLLTPGLHTSFDNYLWGIYMFQGSYIVHVFGDYDRSLHGRRLEFRTRHLDLLPNEKLVEWHYTQCLMTRFRGFVVAPDRG